MTEHVAKPGLGKFEGGPCYAAAFWDQVLDGGNDREFYDGDTLVSCLDVEPQDVTAFPCCLDADDIGKVVLLWESEQGFVNTELMTASEADAKRTACEASEYQVIVGNIGTVYSGTDEATAKNTYAEYRDQSVTGYGRAAHEDVTLMCDNEIVNEHHGTSE